MQRTTHPASHASTYSVIERRSMRKKDHGARSIMIRPAIDLNPCRSIFRERIIIVSFVVNLKSISTKAQQHEEKGGMGVVVWGGETFACTGPG
jgi:hypothetical protein